jgi:hypothetical protein
MPKQTRKQKRTHTQATIDLRRSLVAALVARVPNLSVRGISRILAEEPKEPGHVNPQTKRPWTHGTIHSDVQAIRALWREQMEEDAEDAKSAALAWLKEIIGEAHRQGELANAIRAISEICKVLGLYAPEAAKVEHRIVQVIGGLDEEDF